MHTIHALAGALWWVRWQWFTIKAWIEHGIPFSPKALHPIVGVVLQLAFAALLRTSIARLPPWLIVLALELANEWTDLTVDVWPNRSDQIAGSVTDVLLTMVLPTLLLLAVRYCPGLLRDTRLN
jgi:hypothetical protein